MVIYKCKQCNRTWQHPVKICPFCMIEIERMKSKLSVKVLAISKIIISSLLHPKVPYYSLVVESSDGTKFAYKTFKEFKVGDVIDYKVLSQENSVAIWRINYDILEGIENVVQLLGYEFKKNTSVLIIPALNKANHSYFRDNTSPAFLDAVIEFLKSREVNVSIAQQSTNGSIESLAKKSGLLDICLKHGITPKDLSKEGFKEIDDLKISKIFLEADTIINLGIMKAGKASLSENMCKVLENTNYSALKYLYSDNYIMDKMINHATKVLNIGEAQFVQRDDGFSVHFGAVFAGRNYLNIDRVFNEAVSCDNIPKVLEKINLERVEITGREVDEIRKDVKLVL